MSDKLRGWLEEIRARRESAFAMVSSLCQPRGTQGSREWIMSIPARPDYDPDLVIGAALGDVDALVAKIEELAGALEALVFASRGVPHNGGNLVMNTLEVAIEEAESALRAPGGGSVGELTPERLAELRRVVEAATPGPWMKYDNHVLAGEYARQAAPDLLVTVTSEDSSTDARHIAAFDPPTVLTLLDEIERLRREKEGWKRAARDFEEALDNVREALRLEKTHYLVIHNDVQDVIEERDRLRQERETLAAAVEACGRFAAHLLSCGACRPIDPCSTGRDLGDEWLVAQDEALALLSDKGGGGGETSER